MVSSLLDNTPEIVRFNILQRQPLDNYRRLRGVEGRLGIMSRLNGKNFYKFETRLESTE